MTKESLQSFLRWMKMATIKAVAEALKTLIFTKLLFHLHDLLENFGGHKMACGLEICPENFEIFKQKIY